MAVDEERELSEAYRTTRQRAPARRPGPERSLRSLLPHGGAAYCRRRPARECCLLHLQLFVARWAVFHRNARAFSRSVRCDPDRQPSRRQASRSGKVCSRRFEPVKRASSRFGRPDPPGIKIGTSHRDCWSASRRTGTDTPLQVGMFGIRDFSSGQELTRDGEHCCRVSTAEAEPLMSGYSTIGAQSCRLGLAVQANGGERRLVRLARVARPVPRLVSRRSRPAATDFLMDTDLDRLQERV